MGELLCCPFTLSTHSLQVDAFTHLAGDVSTLEPTIFALDSRKYKHTLASRLHQIAVVREDLGYVCVCVCVYAHQFISHAPSLCWLRKIISTPSSTRCYMRNMCTYAQHSSSDEFPCAHTDMGMNFLRAACLVFLFLLIGFDDRSFTLLIPMDVDLVNIQSHDVECTNECGGFCNFSPASICTSYFIPMDCFKYVWSARSIPTLLSLFLC